MVKNKLKEIRMTKYMMNSNEFCKMIGISPSTYSQIETNKQQGNIETILKIIFSTSFHWTIESLDKKQLANKKTVSHLE